MTPDHVENAKQAVQHVAVTGFSWSATLLTILNLLVGSALVAWIKLRPKMRELDQSADAKLIETLSARVETLEKRMDADRQAFDQKLDAERQRHEAEASLLRHRANNSDQCIDALILVLENADDVPDKVKRAVISIKEMRDRQRTAQALEKGAMTGAKMAAATAVTGAV
ncbi:hypothetical protein [Sphingomonas nostoxanthinifaciens]|uniref:hypothetical protein n=1 Tax=Sphingomonas nostoxanthinifaciens TaxID=2872652 RepID=UPI001CC219AC|nr:hypothetical protein [Sphingomonas nostoxanthinifaciens]UAK25877.1 hypothetical protein K8P63_07080 [Sphingomonas nostoxanthinifaciens]